MAAHECALIHCKYNLCTSLVSSLGLSSEVIDLQYISHHLIPLSFYPHTPSGCVYFLSVIFQPAKTNMQLLQKHAINNLSFNMNVIYRALKISAGSDKAMTELITKKS